MTDGFLSQDEIDALLKGGSQPTSPQETADSSNNILSAMENDALGEIGNIAMGSAATTLSILLGRRVSITTPKVSISTMNKIKNEYPLPYLVIEVGYTHGIKGVNLLAIREHDALIIADLMMGGDGNNPPETMNEIYISAVTEAMNQMMGATATSFSTIFKKKVDISPPSVNIVDFATDPVSKAVSNDEEIVRVAFRMEVEDLIDSEIMQLLTVDVAKDMVNSLLGAVNDPVPKVESKKIESQPSKTVAATQQHTQVASSIQVTKAQQPTNVQPLQFGQIQPVTNIVSDPNMALIMDVPLQVTVELGRTKKLIKDILELSAGSVVELDKLAGEPVDVLVNGKKIAKGEVVVIDENFGVRITEIVSMLERANNIQ